MILKRSFAFTCCLGITAHSVPALAPGGSERRLNLSGSLVVPYASHSLAP